MRKRNLSGIVVCICLAVMMLCRPVDVSAAQTNYLGIIEYYLDGESVSLPAIGFRIDENAFVGAAAIDSSLDFDKVEFLSLGQKTYTLQSVMNIGSLGIWHAIDAGNIANDSDFLELASAYQNQEVYVKALGFEDDDLCIRTVTTTVSEYSMVQDDCVILKLANYPDESLKVMYPAAVLDKAGNCVGIAIEENLTYAIMFDEAAFYGSTPTQTPTQEPTQAPTQEPTQTPTQEPTQTPTQAPTKEPDKKDEKEKSDNLWMIVAFVIFAVAVLAGAFAIRKKNARTGEMVSIDINNRSEVNDIPNDKDEIEDIGSTRGLEEVNTGMPYVDEAKPVAPKAAWLVAEGGYMDGRAYPITQDGVTIGRDVSNVIRYPVETQGVSRKHVNVYWENETLMVMDCGSSNGTYLKHAGELRRLQQMHPVSVQLGDVLYIGEKNNAFRIK